MTNQEAVKQALEENLRLQTAGAVAALSLLISEAHALRQMLIQGADREELVNLNSQLAEHTISIALRVGAIAAVDAVGAVLE